MTENMLLEKAEERWFNNAKATATQFNWTLSESQLKGLCCKIGSHENSLEAKALYDDLDDEDVRINNVFLNAVSRLCKEMTEDEIERKACAIWAYGTDRMCLD